jgi:hypothetical protein
MMEEYEYTRTRYHSYDWGCLVEQGWITSHVEDNPSDGCRIAVMIRRDSAQVGQAQEEKVQL